MNIVTPYYGDSVFSGLWSTVSANVPKSFARCFFSMSSSLWARYDDGAVAPLNVGEILADASHLIACRLKAQAIDDGVAGNNDAGIVMVESISGSPSPTGTTMIGQQSGGSIVVYGPFIPNTSAIIPKAAIISVDNGSILFTMSGSRPDRVKGWGILLAPTIEGDTFFVVKGYANVFHFQCVSALDSQLAKVRYELLY